MPPRPPVTAAAAPSAPEKAGRDCAWAESTPTASVAIVASAIRMIMSKVTRTYDASQCAQTLPRLSNNPKIQAIICPRDKQLRLLAFRRRKNAIDCCTALTLDAADCC